MPLATWLHRHGHTVEVVTGFPNYPGGRFYPGHEPRVWHRESVDGIRINRVPLYPSHDLSAAGRITNYVTFAISATTLGTLMSSRADAVYVYHPPATVGLPALTWKYLRRMPYVFHVQDLWPESVVQSGMIGSGRTQHAVAALITGWCSLVYRGASRIAVQSRGFKQILVERGVPSQKIEVVPNWAEEALFKPAEPDPRLARELQMDDHFNLVYSGNVGYFQGLDVAIRAASRLRHLKNFQLVIIGSGQAEQDLRKLANDLALENVRFLGRKPYTEMGRVTALADALLVSLQDRPFFAATIPGKTQVSLACAKPVVMAVRGDAADLVTKAQAGIVVEPGDEPAFAAGIERLYLLSRDEREAMGARGRDYYVRELSLDSGARRLELLLEAAADDRRRSKLS